MTTRFGRRSPADRLYPPRRGRWLALAAVIVGVGVLFLPWIVALVLVTLWPMGSYGSNK
jgi:hypothetical protein